MRIYTRTGDKGTTGLGNGKRTAKNDPLIHILGEIDELNSSLGFVSKEKKIALYTLRLQTDLFYLASELAGMPVKKKMINTTTITRIEKSIDKIEKELPPLKNFIFPGGSESACHLFITRNY